MARFATAGAKVYIGAAFDDLDVDLVAADFTSQTWVEIKNLTNIGAFGDTSQEVTTQEVGRARDFRMKGTRNAGSMSLTMNINSSDPGQIALIAAEKARNNYAFRIEFPDAPATGSAPVGSQRLFYGLVMSRPENLSGPNNFGTMDVSIGLNSNIVAVAASAGI